MTRQPLKIALIDVLLEEVVGKPRRSKPAQESALHISFVGTVKTDMQILRYIIAERWNWRRQEGGVIIEDDAGRNNALGIHRLSTRREFRMPTRGDVRTR